MDDNANVLQTVNKEHVDEIAQQVAELLATSDLRFSEARLVLQKAWELVEIFPVAIRDPRN